MHKLTQVSPSFDMTAPETWKQIVDLKRKQQAAKVPEAWRLRELPSEDTLDVTDFPENCGLLSTKEIVITNTHVDILLQNLAAGVWTSVEVTTAFSKRAIIAHQLVNCLTEIFIDRALQKAGELDEHLRSTGKVVGPLHGLPISLKDQINIEGVESVMGYVGWVGNKATGNAVLVDILEASGAVLYVKTNVPQTLMWLETNNNVFGRTLNPHNRSLTAGGSSGGEGALIALKGSPLGVGSDIAGSVRIPAAFNGTYGLRGSYGRVPYSGCVNSMLGQDSIPSILGPLATSIGGIKAFLKTVLAQEPWLKDAAVVRKPWNEDEYQLANHGRGEQLCFAVLWHDGHTVPHPPILRGLQKAKRALIAAGHRVVDWIPLKHEQIYEVTGEIFAAGAAEDFGKALALSGEPAIKSMILPDVTPPESNEKPFFSPQPGGISAYDLWQLHKRKSQLRQEYLDHWNATAAVTSTGRPVDAILAPCAASVAPPHGMSKSVGYAAIWNALDYPALVVPTGLSVDPVHDAPRPAHEFYSASDKSNYVLYDPEKFKNAPIAIQIVGRTLEEEALIAMSQIVDEALKISA